MGSSRLFLAPFLGQRIQLAATLGDKVENGSSLVINVNHLHKFVSQHMWLKLPRHHFPADSRLLLDGLVSKYLRMGDFTESYTLYDIKILQCTRFGSGG